MDEGVPKIPKPHHRLEILLFACIALAVWALEFLFQYYLQSRGDIVSSLVRASSFAGATLIGLALSLSVIFRWFPRTARHWRKRRYLGVSGFVFAFMHALSVYYFYFHFDLGQIYFSLNPIENPIVFGTIALPIFMVMALTSSDWAVDKLTPRVWKNIHRLVYVGYLASVFHFITVKPDQLFVLPGYILLAVTAFVLFGHTQLFFKTAIKKRFRSLGSIVGLLIIASALAVAYLLYRASAI